MLCMLYTPFESVKMHSIQRPSAYIAFPAQTIWIHCPSQVFLKHLQQVIIICSCPSLMLYNITEQRYLPKNSHCSHIFNSNNSNVALKQRQMTSWCPYLCIGIWALAVFSTLGSFHSWKQERENALKIFQHKMPNALKASNLCRVVLLSWHIDRDANKDWTSKDKY